MLTDSLNKNEDAVKSQRRVQCYSDWDNPQQTFSNKFIYISLIRVLSPLFAISYSMPLLFPANVFLSYLANEADITLNGVQKMIVINLLSSVWIEKHSLIFGWDDAEVSVN